MILYGQKIPPGARYKKSAHGAALASPGFHFCTGVGGVLDFYPLWGFPYKTPFLGVGGWGKPPKKYPTPKRPLPSDFYPPFPRG